MLRVLALLFSAFAPAPSLLWRPPLLPAVSSGSSGLTYILPSPRELQVTQHRGMPPTYEKRSQRKIIINISDTQEKD
jgi:hypothetical protein